MTSTLTLDSFSDIERVFAIEGRAVRLHRGRGVVGVVVGGRDHFLKRYRFRPSRPLKRYVASGFHELRMIDWLPANGFAGPRVVARGHAGTRFMCSRMFFLMEKIAGESPLEATWEKNVEDRDSLVRDLAGFAARLHDSGFIHIDFSERHIFVGRAGDHAVGDADKRTFHLIDLERATAGRRTEPRAAADLKTLAASVKDPHLKRRLETDLIDEYVALRRTLSPSVDFRALLGRAQPTRSFLRQSWLDAQQSRLNDRHSRLGGGPSAPPRASAA